MFSFRPIEVRLSILETHADLSLDIISHIFSCTPFYLLRDLGMVWYGKVKLILKLILTLIFLYILFRIYSLVYSFLSLTRPQYGMVKLS